MTQIMDSLTIDSYKQYAQSIIDLHKNPVPESLYQLAKIISTLTPTIDIDCDIGRDTHCLNANGFNTIGVDGSL